MIFNRNLLDGEIYNIKFSYNEMVAMSAITSCVDKIETDLSMEDLAIISEAICKYWANNENSNQDEEYKKYPWIKFQDNDECAYISAYAYRVAPYFIDLYRIRESNRCSDSANTVEYLATKLSPCIRCNRCSSPVIKSDDDLYVYQCLSCDEDLYSIETHPGTQATDKEIEELLLNTEDLLSFRDELAQLYKELKDGV